MGPNPLKPLIDNHLRPGRYEIQARLIEKGARRRAAPADRRQGSLVLTAATVGSLGDEAMLAAACRGFRDLGAAPVTAVGFGAGAPDGATAGFDRLVHFGEQFYADFWKTCRPFETSCRSASRFLVLGADMMDGYYNPYECIRRSIFARIASASGCAATIGSFSFNAEPHPLAVAFLDRLPAAVRLVARDPVSHRRLCARLRRPVELGADLAFLLEPDAQADTVAPYLAWAESKRSAGRRCVGINVNYLASEAAGQSGDADSFCRNIAAELALFQASCPDASMLLIPHDYRLMQGRFDDTTLLTSIMKQLPAAVADETMLVDAPLGARQVKALAGALETVLTGRMHLAIASLGQGVPAGGMVYQGKFEGLYEHFGLEGLMFDPGKLGERGALSRFLVGMMERRDRLAERIRERLPAIRTLARLNLMAAEATTTRSPS